MPVSVQKQTPVDLLAGTVHRTHCTPYRVGTTAKLQVTQEKSHVPARKWIQFFRRLTRGLFNSLSLSPIRKMWNAFILNRCNEHSPLWEANCRSPTQKILRLVQYPNVPYHIQDTAPLWARWIQSTSSRHPSLKYKTVRKGFILHFVFNKKIRKNYMQKRVRKGRIVTNSHLTSSLQSRTMNSKYQVLQLLFIKPALNLILHLLTRLFILRSFNDDLIAHI
jgi:hypothetical protein